jgi:hypothetical protein
MPRLEPVISATLPASFKSMPRCSRTPADPT